MIEEPKPEASGITLEEWIASCQSCCGVEPETSNQTPSGSGDSAAAAEESPPSRERLPAT